MIVLVLLIARLLFVALLYLFLFAIMRTGIGMVKGSRKKERGWTVSVERGPKELRGVSIAVHRARHRGPLARGRHRHRRRLRVRPSCPLPADGPEPLRGRFGFEERHRRERTPRP